MLVRCVTISGAAWVTSTVVCGLPALLPRPAPKVLGLLTANGCPASLLLSAGAAHWELLLRARAVECQAYVIAAAQAGKHNEKRESYGHSLIVDPWGTVVGRLEDPLATGVQSHQLLTAGCFSACQICC